MRIKDSKFIVKEAEVYIEHTFECVNKNCNQEDIKTEQKVK